MTEESESQEIGRPKLDYGDIESVKAYIAELEGENRNLREQAKGLKKVVKSLNPRRLGILDIRKELAALIAHHEVAMFS